MCTLTYIPLKNNSFILTSSRDVPFSREKALPPATLLEDGVEMTYPKDGRAGGTWIGTSSKERLICLLNGGFKNHLQKEKYARSRGLIVKDLLKADDIAEACKMIDLENIEPFTLVIVEWDFKLFLFEFVWDGELKHLKILSNEPQIWSSSTLYSGKVKAMRKDWFEEWQKECDIKNSDFELIKEGILNFHHTAGAGDKGTNVMMKRPKVGTVSITQVYRSGDEVQMNYEEVSR